MWIQHETRMLPNGNQFITLYYSSTQSNGSVGHVPFGFRVFNVEDTDTASQVANQTSVAPARLPRMNRSPR